ncbi:MAG: hypothetical protein WDM92_12715 [Caulobacteraceae bacterium]
MTRHMSQQMDYANYSRTTVGMYYQCTGGSTGWGAGAPTCYSPLGYWQDTVRNTHLSNEFRISSPDSWRIRGIAGVYQEDFKIYDDMNFNYKTIPACTPQNWRWPRPAARPASRTSTPRRAPRPTTPGSAAT